MATQLARDQAMALSVLAPPPRSRPLYSSAASDVYTRHLKEEKRVLKEQADRQRMEEDERVRARKESEKEARERKKAQDEIDLAAKQRKLKEDEEAARRKGGKPWRHSWPGIRRWQRVCGHRGTGRALR